MRHAVRRVHVPKINDDDEWVVRVWPGERIVGVETEGQRAWVYIAREV